MAGAAPPDPPEIFEPAPGGAPLNPADVHMEANYSDPDGDEHECSDWEIWTVDPEEPVWRAHCATGVGRIHIHLGDGDFVNSHAGRTALEHSTDYELRARFRDGSGEWSTWAKRAFRTIPPGPQGEATPIPWTARHGYVVEVFATGFQLPVSVAMVPNPGRRPSDPLLYVAELYGAIKVVTRSGRVRTYAKNLLNFNPTGKFPGSGEQGVGGLVVEPRTGDVLASVVYADRTSPDDPKPHYPKVVRLHSNKRGLAATRQTTIIDMKGELQGASHQVSNLTITPNRLLIVHNADGGYPNTARDLDSMRGKILRMTLSGAPVGGNPYYSRKDGITARDYIFASGFRNPFGGAWRSSDMSDYTVENGPYTDRLTKIVRGRDYGWQGSNDDMDTFAWYNWANSHAPVDIEFLERDKFGGSGFPLASMDHAFVTESGSTYSTGPQVDGKQIVEFDLRNGGVEEGPVPLVKYHGTGKATAAGLASGPGGVYFTDLYKDQDYSSPIDRGANLLRIRYTKPPRIGRFEARKKRFAVGGRRPRRGGTAFVYSLSKQARARIRIRKLSGRPQGVIKASGLPGGNRRRYLGYLGRGWLPPGRYTATLLARDAMGNSAKPRSVRFRVVRRPG